MKIDPQPRASDGKFGEKPDVGLQQRLTDQLRHRLGHDGQTPLDPAETEPLDAELDLDAELAAQVAAIESLPQQTVVEAPAEPVLVGGGKSLDDDLDRQSAVLDALEHKGWETDETKIRHWDPDLHPRDHRGRFATIGSTVTLPESAGGGDGRVIAAAGGGRIRVRKPDGGEVEVDAKDTTVTRSAAANAAHGSFIHAAGEGGFAHPDAAAAEPTRAAAAGTPQTDAAAKPRAELVAPAHADGARVTKPDGSVGTVLATGKNGVGVRGQDGTLTVHQPHELAPAADTPNAGPTNASALKVGDVVSWHDPDGDVSGTVDNVEDLDGTIRVTVDGASHKLLPDAQVDVSGATTRPDALPALTREEAVAAATRTVDGKPYAKDPELRAAAISQIADALMHEDNPSAADPVAAREAARVEIHKREAAGEFAVGTSVRDPGSGDRTTITARNADGSYALANGGTLPGPATKPGAEIAADDGIDRSAWTGGIAPNGATGVGDRPDGTAWGSGYPPSDPRTDPAYDQYTTELDAHLEATLAEIGDTETIYDKVGGVPGAYNPARQAQHDALLDELMAGFADVPKENKAIVMAGPPGAGKSSVIAHQGSEFGVEAGDGGVPSNYAVVNPDDMKELIVAKGLIPPDYPGRGIGPGESATFMHEESSHLAARLLTRLKAGGHNVILDGTFSGNPDKQAGKVHALRADGYAVTGVLVDGTVERSLENAARRHRRPPLTAGAGYEGRYVPYGLVQSNRPSPDAPESTVFGRPHRNKASENIEAVADAFDGGVFWYDNATGASTLVHHVGPGQTVTAGTDVSAKAMDAATRAKKPTMPDGSFPIGNVDDLDNAVQSYGRAKDKDKARRWITRRARELDAISHLPDGWNVTKNLLVTDPAAGDEQTCPGCGDVVVFDATDGYQRKDGSLSHDDASVHSDHIDVVLSGKAWFPDETKGGGADRNRGNAERLRRYWTHGEGAAKIRWGTPGDHMRCVAQLMEHAYFIEERAHGYCNLREKEATGLYPAQHAAATKALSDALGLGPWLPDLEVKADPPASDPDANKAGVENTNPAPQGVMVALYPPDDIAQALHLDAEQAEDVSELHVTLAYLGSVDEVGLEQVGALVQLVADFAADSYDQPFEVSGIGRWAAGEDGDAFVALIDGPELPDLRADVVDALTAGGFPVRNDHGFTPHITLAYLDAADPSPLERLEALPGTFGWLSVAVGPDVWDFPLAADDEAETAEAAGTQATEPVEAAPAPAAAPAEAPA